MSEKTESDKPTHTGVSRTAVHPNHALITPESHVPIILPGWRNTTAIVLIAPEMGAKFTQCIVTCEPDAEFTPLRESDETFAFVMEGEVSLAHADEPWTMAKDDYAVLPPATPWRIASSSAAKLLLFTKPYVATADPPPAPLRGALGDVPAEPFLGDPAALLQVLLPDDPAYDWGINVFEFAPGGTLPQVESHFMEHGLYLLEGEGVYRLGDHWYPVTAGDTIWMGPYLPQWFAATGKTHSRYIYYKEMNRAPIDA